MSQAIAQSVSQITPSTPREINLRELVVRNATKSVRGVTRERIMLNASKLMHLCRDEYKSWRSMERVQRLPDEIEEALQVQVNKYINENIQRIHVGNVLTFRTFDYHDARNLRITERLSALGQNNLSLQAQLEGCKRIRKIVDLKIEKYEKLDASGNSHKDYGDILESLREQRDKLSMTEHHIRGTIAEINKASTPETPEQPAQAPDASSAQSSAPETPPSA